MGRIFCSFAFVTAMVFIQGCFWHTTEVEHDVPANSSTTVVVPSGSTVSNP